MAEGHSILILDADAFLAGIYARRLEEAHWSVRVTETLEEAEKALLKEVPSLILVDIASVKDPEATIAKWKKTSKTAGMTIVVLTKLGDRKQVKALKDAGADNYLLKGHFVPREVTAKLERLVSEE